MRRVPGLCTGLAVLLLSPVATKALSLGEINVRSTLGEPLHATVPVRLAPGESLAGSCITTIPPAGGAGALSRARISQPQTNRPGAHQIQITTTLPLVEPMYELALQVNCPGAPVVVRQYVLMLDLPGTTLSATAHFGAAAATFTQAAPVATSSAAETPPVRRSTAPAARTAGGTASATTRPREPLAAGSRYRVRAGDTLSSIAARVSGRSGTIWQTADAIHAANPDAFIRNNRDLIRLGSEIVIPGTAPVEAAQTTPATATASAPATSAPIATTAAAAVAAAAREPVMETSVAVPADATLEPARETVSPAARQLSAPAVAGSATPMREPVAAQAEVRTEARPEVRPEVQPEVRPEIRPWVAAAAGTLFGLVVSAILWFRRVRLPWPRQAVPAASDRHTRELPEPASAAATIKILPIQADRKPEPSFTVSYSVSEDDDPLAGEFTPADEGETSSVNRTLAEEITAELEELFNADATTEQPALHAADESATPNPDGDETIRVESHGENPQDPQATSAIDLPSLAAGDGTDEKHAQTLMEALSLLERDYQEEFTASQVLDLDAVRAAMDKEDLEPTQLRRKSR